MWFKLLPKKQSTNTASKKRESYQNHNHNMAASKQVMRKRTKSVAVDRPSLFLKEESDYGSDTSKLDGAIDLEDDYWTKEETNKLIALVEEQTKKDKCMFKRSIKKLDWSKISISGKSTTEVQSYFTRLCSKIRTYRIMPELLQDMRVFAEKTNAPKPPKKPMTALAMHLKENKFKLLAEARETGQNLMKLNSDVYYDLPEKEKERYNQQVQKAKDKYNKKLSLFYLQHPEMLRKKPNEELLLRSPIYFYLKERRKIENPKLRINDVREDWKSLSEKEKVKYIQMATEVGPESEVQVKISKDEKKILNMFNGVPNSTPTAYRVFFKEIYDSVGGTISERNTKISELWKSLSDEKKIKYQKKALNIKEEYIKLAKDMKNERDNLLTNRKRVSSETINDVTNNVKKIKTTEPQNNTEDTTATEPEKPPKSLKKYFMKYIYQGDDMKQAKSDFKNLSNSKLSKYDKKFKVMQDLYILDFKKYIESLPKKVRKAKELELEAYKNSTNSTRINDSD